MGLIRPLWVEARHIDFSKSEVGHHDQNFPYLLLGLLQAKENGTILPTIVNHNSPPQTNPLVLLCL